jgi:hypothetical protein
MATEDDIGRLDKKIDSVESSLAGKINRLDTKLTKFEEHEIDKRVQLEVRVSAIEKHLGLDKKIVARPTDYAIVCACRQRSSSSLRMGPVNQMRALEIPRKNATQIQHPAIPQIGRTPRIPVRGGERAL